MVVEPNTGADEVKYLLVFACFVMLCCFQAAAGASGPVGIYDAAAAGGRTGGLLAIRNTLEEAGLDVESFTDLSLKTLLNYRAVILPSTRQLPGDEVSGWEDNLRAYVAEAGGALVFYHNSVGHERSPFNFRIPLFPEIVVPRTVERIEALQVRVALDRAYYRDYDYLPGYESGQTAEHMYFDRQTFIPSSDAEVLLDCPETGNAVVAVGKVGRGRVVFNGMFSDQLVGQALELTGIDRDVTLNTVKWALEGDGLVVASADEMEVARWAPDTGISAPAAEQSIAFVFSAAAGAQALSREVAEENLRRAGIDYDFILFDFLAVRGLSKRDYPLAVISLPLESGKLEIEAIKSYLNEGGKAIIILPSNVAGEGRGLLEMFSCEVGASYRNTFRPEKIWARFRKIVFTDAAHLPARIENIPRTLRDISLTSDDARVIAYWEDLAGEVNIPAVIRHEYGYLFNNNSFGDLHNLRMFLANAVIELVPREREKVYENLSRLYRDRRVEVTPAVTAGEGMRYLREAGRLERSAAAAAGKGDYREANFFLVEADRLLVYAYAASMDSPAGEKRSVSMHHVLQPEETVARIASAGLNELTMSQRPAMFSSELFDVDGREDELQEWIDAGARHDVGIGVSFAPFQLYPGSEAHRRAREENWGIVPPEDYGKPKQPLPENLSRAALCRSRSGLIEHGVARAVEVARKYPVSVINFDGIRWPSGGRGMQYCVCDYCRENFQKDTGIQLENWPADALGKYIDEFNDWRASRVTRVVMEASEQVKEINPDINIAVNPRPDLGNNLLEGQYWWEWTDHVDFMVIMRYTNDVQALSEKIKEFDGKIPAGARARIAPIISVTGHRPVDPLVWLRQIEAQRELAPAGIKFFHYAFLSEPALELLRIGPYRER